MTRPYRVDPYPIRRVSSPQKRRVRPGNDGALRAVKLRAESSMKFADRELYFKLKKQLEDLA